VYTLKNRKILELKEKNKSSKTSNASLDFIETSLMQKKEQEHDYIFNKNNQDKKIDLKTEDKSIEEEYKKAVKIAVNNFSINVTSTCNFLSGINTKLKKSDQKEALKGASLTLFSSSHQIIRYMQDLSSITGDLNNVQYLENLIPFLRSSNNLLSNLLLSNMDKQDYENSKSIIVSLSQEVVNKMNIGIKYSAQTDYGLSKSLISYTNILKDQIAIVQKMLKRYEGKLKQLIKTIEEFENENTNKMPLMGEAGSN